MNNGLIPHSHAERLARKSDKRRRLLGFLRTETWTTPSIASMVMGISDRRTTKGTLDSMAGDGLVVRDKLRLPLGLTLHIVGITTNGQAEAASLTGKPFVARAYETGRIGLTVIDHTLDLQRLRIAAARAGWKGWAYLDRIPLEERKDKRHRADALATHPSGQRAAIEAERTMKTKKRYQVIVGDHLSAIAQRQYDRVVYTAPNTAIVEALRQTVTGLPRVLVQGVDTRLTQEHLARFLFCTYDQFLTLNL